MGRKTGIEWTDSTWNPVRGCSRVSEGCTRCYAESVAARFSGPGQPYEGLAKFVIVPDETGVGVPQARWTNELRFIEKHLDDPIHWQKPSRIFVNSMSDLFHPAVTFEWLAKIFDVMARAPQHTYQILTKRPQRMLDTLVCGGDPDVARSFEATYSQSWPPKNWWFGVSVEDQKTANERIPILGKCPAKTKFVSYEPALGPVDLAVACVDPVTLAEIDWIIAGGESGSHARPSHPQWFRDVRDLCDGLGTPFYFKQWGEWAPVGSAADNLAKGEQLPSRGYAWAENPPGKPNAMVRIGKRRAGALLDGIAWLEFPR
jgi:protein gp37